MPASAIFTVQQVSEAAKVLRQIVRRKDIVLLKASRGIQMEKVVGSYARGWSMKVREIASHY